MTTLFFELLQIAIGTRASLSRTLTEEEWAQMYEVCKEQALLGIGYVAVLRLTHEQRPPKRLIARWSGIANSLKVQNDKINAECRLICDSFARHGVTSVVLKGQSNLEYYPKVPTLQGEVHLGQYRTSGDIDLWCYVSDKVEIKEEKGGQIESRTFSGVEAVVEFCLHYARRVEHRDIPWHRILYYHCELTSKNGIGVEPHYRPSFFYSPLRNRRAQRWFEKQKGQAAAKEQLGFATPSVAFNAVYQLTHIYRHLFQEGIGLRQLLDYYFVLQAGISRNSRDFTKETIRQLNRLGMHRFTGAVMYVLQKVFALPDSFLLCPPNSKEGRWLLSEILLTGNFGMYDDRVHYTGTATQRGWIRLKRDLRLMTHYPEECICEPFFRLYHWMWRRFKWWRYE